jgi:hypothetical protein
MPKFIKVYAYLPKSEGGNPQGIVAFPDIPDKILNEER